MSDDYPLIAFTIVDGEFQKATPEELTAETTIRVCVKAHSEASDRAAAKGVPQAPSFCCFCGADIVYNPFQGVPSKGRMACTDCMEAEALRQREAKSRQP